MSLKFWSWEAERSLGKDSAEALGEPGVTVPLFTSFCKEFHYLISRLNHPHFTWSPEPECPCASSEFSKINHWRHQNRVEGQDGLLSRLQVIYLSPVVPDTAFYIWVPWLWAVIYVLDLTMRWVRLVHAEDISVWIWKWKRRCQGWPLLQWRPSPSLSGSLASGLHN